MRILECGMRNAVPPHTGIISAHDFSRGLCEININIGLARYSHPAIIYFATLPDVAKIVTARFRGNYIGFSWIPAYAGMTGFLSFRT